MEEMTCQREMTCSNVLLQGPGLPVCVELETHLVPKCPWVLELFPGLPTKVLPGTVLGQVAGGNSLPGNDLF
jgi:hypothetical protein